MPVSTARLTEIARPTSKGSTDLRYRDDPSDSSSLEQFKAYLGSNRTRPVPALTWATPGLSQHGQAKAFDFVVHDGAGKVIVGTNSSQKHKWREERWSEQLKSAITGAKARFSGPLTSPDEPWHFIYTPAAPPAQ
jgi:hypothetical protein